MNIVLAVHQLPPHDVGGVGLFTVHLAEEFQRLGYAVTILAGSEERIPEPTRVEVCAEAATGVPCLRLLRTSRSRLGRFLGSFISRDTDALLEQELAKLRPDVLHFQHTLHFSGRLASIGIAAGAAVVASVHDFWPICQRIDLRRPDGTVCPGPAGGVRCAACLTEEQADPSRWLRRPALAGARLAPYLLRTQVIQGCFQRAHKITCPSPITAETLQRNGFDSSRIRLVDYGVPLHPPGVAEAPRPGTPFRFGFLGTLGPHKGLLVALRAMEQNRNRPWKLMVHGGPLRDPDLRRLLEERQEQGALEYLGPYSELHLPGILANLDALIIPSLWPETGPMVWMEAVSAGLPVIASRVGALASRVHHQQDGLLFPMGDPAALGAAMEQLVEQYDRFRSAALGRRTRTVQQAALDLIAVYEEALAAR